MKAGAIHREGVCLIPLVWRADDPLSRLRGLLGRAPLRRNAEEGLLLVPCNSVHTFGMRYALDVVFLDAREKVMGWRCDVRPCRARAWWRARQALELAAGGVAKLHPTRGEKWIWLPI